jgi:hypothetical protein
MKALLALAGISGLVAIALVGHGSVTATHLGIAHQTEPQSFVMDAQTCSGTSTGMTAQEDATATLPLACPGENLTPGAGTSAQTSLLLTKGNRLATRTTYRQAGFSALNDGAIANGTVVGGVKGQINIGCDDTADYVGDDTTGLDLPITGFSDPDLDPQPLLEQTTAWGASTGPGGLDESYLTKELPPFTRVVRYRADIDFVILGTTVPVYLSDPLPDQRYYYTYNIVVQTPPWMIGLGVVSRTFGQGSRAPVEWSNSSECVDSMDSWSESVTGGGFTNPSTPGLYAVWTTHLSSAGLQDETVQTFSYVTSCKMFGPPVADADNDCWVDTADANPGDRDIDNDGLLDGIEVAWVGAACAGDSDCDNDGRTDAEEMVGPGKFLTNPLSGDSDSDGFSDAGFHLDCGGDGIPDALNQDLSMGPGTGRNRVTMEIRYCKPDGSSTNGGTCTQTPLVVAGCGGRPWGNVGVANADNCPNINAGQGNSANVLPDLDALPVSGDSNGRFNGMADATHPDGRFSGDACEPDADNDGIDDVIEAGMFFDASGGTGGVGNLFCNNNLTFSGSIEATDGDEAAAATSPTNRDSDGDGSADGAECSVGRNPASAASKPGTTLNPGQSVTFRLSQLTRPGMSFLADLDDDDVPSGVAEVRGGLSGNVADTDRDGCHDNVELADVDGNRSATSADQLAVARARFLYAPFTGGLTPEEIRTMDLDANGLAGEPDRLGIARIVLSASLPTIPDFQLICNAARIGEDAN